MKILSLSYVFCHFYQNNYFKSGVSSPTLIIISAAKDVAVPGHF